MATEKAEESTEENKKETKPAKRRKRQFDVGLMYYLVSPVFIHYLCFSSLLRLKQYMFAVDICVMYHCMVVISAESFILKNSSVIF